MDAKKILEEAINKVVEEIIEATVVEWEGKNGVGLKYINRQIRQIRKEKYPLRVIEELSDSIGKIKKIQIPRENIRKTLGNLILLSIDYCDSLNYDPDECVKLALQYFV